MKHPPLRRSWSPIRSRRPGQAARRPGDKAFRPKLEALESRVVPAILDHTAGFYSHADVTTNGNARVFGSTAELVDGNNGEAGSLFSNFKVDLASFYTTFNFQMRAGTNPIADGLAFVIQNDSRGASALGGGGGQIGYVGINNSAAISFRAYTSSVSELLVNGTAQTTNPLAPIDFNAAAQSPPHPFRVALTYTQSNTTLTEYLTDLNTNTSKTFTYAVNLQTVVGGTQAYVGFTGGTGGLNLVGDVQSWYGQFLPYTAQTLTSLSVSTPAPAAIGTPASVTVRAQDQNGNLYVGYTGTVHFTSSDAQATLPSDYAFTPADGGRHTFSVTFNNAGSRTLTATDTANAQLTSTATAAVTAGVTIPHSSGFLGTTDLTPNGTAAYVGSAAIGIFQSHNDIGTPGNPSVAGTVSYNAGSAAYTLTASGSDIGFSTPDQDHFQYVYNQGTLANNAEFYARVASLTNTNFWTKAVIHIRTSLDPSAPDIQIVMSPHNETEMTWRDSQGGGTGAHERGSGTGPLPGWIRLVRNGSSFTGYWAADNGGMPGTWMLGETHTSPNIGNNNVYVGLGLTSHDNTAVATAVIDHVTLTGFTPNSSSGAVAELVNGAGGQAGSLYTNYKVGVKGFSTSFTFQLRPGGNPIADGLTFALQNDPRGPMALGDSGGSLGYAREDNSGNFPATTNSVAVKFDAWKPNGNHSSTGLYVNGHRPNNPPDTLPGDQYVDLAGTGIDFNAGAQASPPHTFQVDLSYDGTTLNEVITDLATHTRFTHGYTVNLSTYLGASNTAYAGFTGGTGGVTSIQDILSWSGTFYQYQQTLTSLGVSAPAVVNVGAPFSPTVTALDQKGAPFNAYTGTVHFTSSDMQAVLPANYTFTANDNGQHTFFDGVTLNTSGTQTITATDTVTSTLTGSTSVAVSVPAASFMVAGFPNPATAGTAGSVTVTALDSMGHAVTGYLGTVHFTSSDPQAVLPMDYAFTAADMGVHMFTNGVTLKTAGTQSITVTDTASSATGSQANIIVNAGATSKFVVTGFPATTTAGVSHTFNVSASDAFGNSTPNYTGTVHFSSTDTQAMLPMDYMFTTGDMGSHTFTGTLKTAGTRSITVTDTTNGSITGSQTGIRVNPAAAVSLAVTGFPSPTTAGAAQNFTVSAKDPYGNTDTNYLGLIHFSSSDPQAVLPGDTVLITGTGTFSATLKTAGTQSISVVDTSDSTINGMQSGIVVNPAATSTLVVTGYPTAVTAGTAGDVTVTAKDAFGNVTPAYAGTVHFTSSDGQAVLPTDYPFTAADMGTHTFTGGVTLKTAGTQSITATDTANSMITGRETGIVVSPAAASTFTVTGVPTSVLAGSAQSFTVTARDPYNNVATGYTGTVHFTSSDTHASLPTNYAFTAADHGAHTFGVVFRTAGTQSITATDTTTGTITGSETGIVVSPAGLRVSGFPSSVTAGTPGSVTVTAVDVNGNPTFGYVGTVHFTSSDPQAVLPMDYTFTAADNGQHTFSGVVLKTAGTQSITATDSASNFTATQSGIVVSAAAFTVLNVTGYPSPATAGTSASVTVTAQDAYGNPVPGYMGTVHFTSTDPQAVLPADYTFTAADNGQHTFSGVVLKTAGTQSIIATDVATGDTGSEDNIVVTHAAVDHYRVMGPSTVIAGDSFQATVTAVDAYGNTVTDYTGTVNASSNLGEMQSYTFTADDMGTHTFTLVRTVAGSRTETLTDSMNPSVTTTVHFVVVAAALDHLAVNAPANVGVGQAFTFTVIAQDAFNNTVPDYTGTVTFSSSDPNATLPHDYTFTAADNGMHTFGAVLNTSGAQTLTATDNGNNASGTATINATDTPVGGLQTAPADVTSGAAAPVAPPGDTVPATAPAPAVTPADVAPGTTTGVGTAGVVDDFFAALAGDPLAKETLGDPLSAGIS